jgi:LacI family transcriptional regulator, galactose operon repressor
MGKARVTLKDIARETGFSTNTVSLALRDSTRIPEATRDRIKLAAEALNYLPNQIAQSLVSQQTMTIGLILTDIRNPVLTQVAQEIGNLLSDRGYSTLFATSNNTVPKELDVVDTFRRRQVDGMLVYPTDHFHVEHLSRLRRMDYPIVSLVADPSRSLDTVSVNEVSGGYKATKHLISVGCRRIANLDAAAALGNTEKQEGYLKALKEAGIKSDKNLMVEVSGHGIGFGYSAIEKLWASGARPDAVVASNDSLALGVQRWCDDNGLKVPDDIAIVGFDNIEFGRFAAVPLTTVAYPVEQISRTAVDNLLSLVSAKGDLPSPVETLHDPELLVRKSSTRGSV